MNREAELAAALDGLVDIVERVGCGDWRNERGQRLKDTKQWVVAYLAATKKAQPAAPVPAQPAFLAQDPTGRLSVLMREAAARESVPAQPAVVPEWQLRTPADQRMVDLVRHLATYPATRADELMAADMRKMCRDAVSIYDAAILSTTDTEVNNGPA